MITLFALCLSVMNVGSARRETWPVVHPAMRSLGNCPCFLGPRRTVVSPGRRPPSRVAMDRPSTAAGARCSDLRDRRQAAPGLRIDARV